MVFGTLVAARCCSAAFRYVVNAGTVVMREIKNRRQFPGMAFDISAIHWKILKGECDPDSIMTFKRTMLRATSDGQGNYSVTW